MWKWDTGDSMKFLTLSRMVENWKHLKQADHLNDKKEDLELLVWLEKLLANETGQICFSWLE